MDKLFNEGMQDNDLESQNDLPSNQNFGAANSKYVFLNIQDFL